MNKNHASSRSQHFDRFYNFRIMWKYGYPSSSKYIRKKKNSVSNCHYCRPSLWVFSAQYLSLFTALISKRISDDFAVELSPLFWYCFTFSMVAVFSSNPNFNDSIRFHRLRLIVRSFSCRYSLRLRLIRMIYMEIDRLQFMRNRDLIFLKFKRNIFSSPKFALILVVIKVFCLVGFLFFRFIDMHDFKVENGIPSMFRYVLSGMSKSFYWMKPLYVIDEPITRLYQSPEERRQRNTEAQLEKRKKCLLQTRIK